MNLVFGEVVTESIEGGMRVGKIRVGGAMKNVLLDLVTVAEIGDSILLCDGLAVAKVDKIRTTENDYVSGNSGKAD